MQVRRIFPDFQANTWFITKSFTNALKLDAKRSSHPVEVSIPNASMIGQVSGYLHPLYSCTHGGSLALWRSFLLQSRIKYEYIKDLFHCYTNFLSPVLRMLSSFIGVDKFLQGVSAYLQKHIYGNTTTEDLWDGISSVTGIDIRSIMDVWVKKVCIDFKT